MNNDNTLASLEKKYKDYGSSEVIVHGKLVILRGYESWAADQAMARGDFCPVCHNVTFPGDSMLYHDLCVQGTVYEPRKKQVEYTKHKISDSDRWEIWERDNFTCQNCGSRKNLTIDHIQAESRGGKSDKDNYQTLCKSCNSRKGAR